LFGNNGNSNDTFGLIAFFGNNIIIGGFTINYLVTSAVYRDASAWMHVVVTMDTTQATTSNRLKIYINGSEVTTFSTDNRSSISQNSDQGINQAVSHAIGRQETGSGSSYFSGYLANIHFIDGQALTPASFAETDATTGQWIPKAFSGGSYGTNGFYLQFADNSSNTASTLGKDYSGLGNNWTPNNLSVTAGAGNDSLIDSPTNYGTDTGVGGEVRGNYCTFNPLVSGATLSNGNLDCTGSGGSYGGSVGTIGLDSGKYYWEYTITNNYASAAICGISAKITGPFTAVGDSSEVEYQNNYVYANGSLTSGLQTIVAGDVIGITWDGSTRQVKFYRNNSLQATVTATNIGTYFPGFGGIVNDTASVNFGQRAFAYTAPSGFKALCTQNLPAPLVTKSNTVFDTILYSGNNSTQSITSLAFNPDMVWSKCRNVGRSHRLSDAIRGSNVDLYTDTTASDNFYGSGSITAFTANGFNLDNSASSQYNTSGETYVSWCWDAGTSTVSNTQGSITSQVRANVSAGFSVVTWTGTGANATIGHGGLLNLGNGMIIVKNRTSSATNWRVYHSALGSTKTIFLSLTNAPDTSIAYWNNTSPTSTVFSVGYDDGINGSGNAMVAYCFAPVVGYSSFGSYTGNGSTDGPFVYTGFKVKWLMIKRTDSTSNWFMIDASRSPYNEVNDLLYAEQSLAETVDDTNNGVDFLSNGFKLRKGVGGTNISAATLIYAAFAESPFNYSRAR